MAGDDLRYYETFYGIHTNDWDETFGTGFVEHHKLLVKEYISDACNTTEASGTSLATHEFLYPHHIKKTYFIEGVATGHITLVASTCSTSVCSFRVTICKVHQDTAIKTELFTTGWRTVNTTLNWDAVYSVGDEVVYYYEIDAWEKEKLTEFERIFVRVQVTTTNSCCSLYHSNDSTWEDIRITIPFKM